jgi:uncharacterized protein
VKFAAIIEYITDQDKIQSIRPTHREYLGSLRAAGKLAASGPFTDGSGALIIYETETVDEAEQLIHSDPFHQSGIFVSWQLRPWNQVM